MCVAKKLAFGPDIRLLMVAPSPTSVTNPGFLFLANHIREQHVIVDHRDRGGICATVDRPRKPALSERRTPPSAGGIAGPRDGGSRR